MLQQKQKGTWYHPLLKGLLYLFKSFYFWDIHVNIGDYKQLCPLAVHVEVMLLYRCGGQFIKTWLVHLGFQIVRSVIMIEFKKLLA
jgi:hypothetical protein